MRLVLNEGSAFLEGFLIHGDEVPVALWESLLEALEHVLDSNDGLNLEVSAKHNHVERLAVVNLDGSLGSLDAIDLDIGASGRSVDAIAVIDEHATWFHHFLKLVETLLVEHHSSVIHVEDW